MVRPERLSENQLAELILKEVKRKTGDVIHVAISDKVTIELPAHLSQEERDARVANYIRLHKSGV